MFSFLGRENPPVQLYGKLPIAKDYLRLGCGEGSARDLREWLDRAFGGSMDASQQLVLSEPLRFLGQSDKDPLQGVLWPSSDAGGLRRFPFTLCVARKRKALANDLEEGLGQAEGVWRKLAHLREECLAAADGQGLLGSLRGRELELTESERVESVSTDLDAWVAALWPEDGLDGLHEMMGSIRTQARSGHAAPYRVPLVRGLPLRDQVLGWVGVFRALGALNGELPSLFFSMRSLGASGDLASLVVARSPLTEDQAVWLLPPGGVDLGPADFLPAFAETEPEVSSPPEGETPLRDALRTVLDSFLSQGGPN
jgi:hypothetical protein